jgi:hypothetical protein
MVAFVCIRKRNQTNWSLGLCLSSEVDASRTQEQEAEADEKKRKK